jgi:hypothetical protein
VHVLAPWSEQAQVFSIEGHDWPLEPGRAGSTLVSSLQVGGLEAVTLQLRGGAGGVDHVPGDYVYGDHRGPYLEAGLWGILRVLPADAKVPGLLPLTTPARSTSKVAVALGAVAVLALIALVALVTRRRRRSRTSPPGGAIAR